MISHRLEEVRISKGFNKKDFATKLGITAQGYNNYYKGEREIPTDLSLKINHLFNISLDWLLTGKGSMYLEEKKSNSVITHGDINSNGEDNIILNGVQDCDINHQAPVKPTNKRQTIISTEEELDELFTLIKDYATPKYRMEIKEKLLRFKELH